MSVRDTEPVRPAAAEDEGGFLRRWSQRKQALARGETPPEPAPPAPPPAPVAREDEAPLPDPAGLTLADDFRGFLRPKVPPELKRQALTQLFSQAHFNQVDGLDVYMDDYNLVPDMSDADRGLLRHARAVLEPTPSERLADAEARPASGPVADVAGAGDAAPELPSVSGGTAGEGDAPAADIDPPSDGRSA